MVRTPARMGSLAALAAAVLLAGCETETRVIRDNRPLANLPGAVVAGGSQPARRGPGIVDPTFLPPEQLRITAENGDITLNARSGRHLMTHIAQTLLNNERDLFTEQVLSEVTKQEFRARGLDPAEAFDLLRRQERDVMELFNAMPLGERTPGAVFENLGRADRGGQIARVRMTGSLTNELRYTAMDMVMEKGSWRLRWFGRPREPRSR